ncbi:Poly [ADP-ribose] polymerase 1 [Triticum urartu]|uniref:Poly [ADP-ribose] polymerase 1 n=1 Tax=Triticum urartu TaxID=4572 RepID=M7ZIB4_TRIUA|nr:Poly [ADP-ribose] polymerase 1 [Triticum urartu]
MAAPPPKAWKAEYAKSGRSSCKSCKSPIAKDALRLGKMVQATQFDGFMPMWNHAKCILNKKNQIKSVDDVEGIDALRWDDQEKIRNYAANSSTTSTATATASSTAAIPDKCAIEVAQSARSSCRRCSVKIAKGTLTKYKEILTFNTSGRVRVSSKLDGQGWYHVSCFLEMSPTASVEKFPGWETLLHDDRAAIIDVVKKGAASKQETTSKGSKRKIGDIDVRNSKAPNLDGSTSEGAARSKGKLVVPCEPNSSSADLHQKLKEQSDTLWKLKDELKKHVSTAELRDMLEVNEQDPSGPERDLLERWNLMGLVFKILGAILKELMVKYYLEGRKTLKPNLVGSKMAFYYYSTGWVIGADGMLFGALGTCPVCNSCLYYYGGHYQCNGHVSEWSKCTYMTTEPVRMKKKWKIPDEIKNDYLTKWFKSQKVKKPERVLPPMSPQKSVGQSPQQSLVGEALDKLRVCIVGQSKDTDEWKQKLKLAGAHFSPRVTKDINCVVSCGGLDNESAEVRKARRQKIPIVREDYLGECIRKNRVLPFDLYRVATTLEESSKGSTVTVKVKGRSAVHEASGLQDTGHILENGKSIYNTTLNISDMTQGVNRQGFCS